MVAWPWPAYRAVHGQAVSPGYIQQVRDGPAAPFTAEQ